MDGQSSTGHRAVVLWRTYAPYRGLLVLVLLTSVASFAALSVLSLFARDELGASDVMVTVVFVAVALAGMIAMPVTGRFSDRGRVRQMLIPASLAWLAIGYLLLSVVRSYAAFLAVSVVFFCAVGIPSAQLLAYARDLAYAHGGGEGTRSTAVISLVRIVFSVGSFLGFAAGGLGLAYVGARSVFSITALLCLGCLLLSRYVVRPPATSTQDAVPQRPPVEERRTQPAGNARRLLLVLMAVMVLYNSGRVMQLAQLPILLRATLDAPLQLVGFALAVPPLAELVLMPVMAWAAVRWGRGRVFLGGGVAIVVYYLGLVFVVTPGQLLLLQVAYAAFGAATVMVGIDLAQRLLAGRAGLATSMYLSHENVAAVNGSIIATVSVAALGHQVGFAVPGALCLIALLVTVGLFVRHPDRFDLRREHTAPSPTPSLS